MIAGKVSLRFLQVAKYSTVDIMQAKTDGATTEDHEEIAERPEVEAKAGTRKGYRFALFFHTKILILSVSN